MTNEAVPRPLPDSETELAYLLQKAEELSAFIERVLMHTNLRIASLKKLRGTAAAERELGRSTAKWDSELRRLVMQGSIGHAVLFPYLDDPRLDVAGWGLGEVQEVIRESTTIPEQIEALEHAAALIGVTLQVAVNLQRRILAFREERRQRTEPDTNPDSEKKSVPRKHVDKLLRFGRLKNRYPDQPDSEIAERIADDQLSADSLLRAVRRHRKWIDENSG